MTPVTPFVERMLEAHLNHAAYRQLAAEEPRHRVVGEGVGRGHRRAE